MSTTPPPVGSQGYPIVRYGTLVPAVDANSDLSRTDGGKRTTALRDRVMTSMSLRDWRKGIAHARHINGAASLSGPKTVEVGGYHFLQQPGYDKKQALASRAIAINGADMIMVYARFPGKLGNDIQITVAAPTGLGAIAVDSDEATAVPKVLITPKTGDPATTITQINNSKLVRAVLVGVAPAFAAEAAANLAGGQGPGVRYYLGSKIMHDTTAHGASFVGSANGSRISMFTDNRIDFIVDEADLVVGEAVPTGMSALVAAESGIDAVIEWPDPAFQLPIYLPVVA